MDLSPFFKSFPQGAVPLPLERGTRSEEHQDNTRHGTAARKTPEMATEELWANLLAYNLIRLLMAEAALLADQIPRQLSFKHKVQIWIAWQQRDGGTHDAVSINALLLLIAEPQVGFRPGRVRATCHQTARQTVSVTHQTATRHAGIRKHWHPQNLR